jgi:hypothetical protein
MITQKNNPNDERSVVAVERAEGVALVVGQRRRALLPAALGRLQGLVTVAAEARDHAAPAQDEPASTQQGSVRARSADPRPAATGHTDAERAAEPATTSPAAGGTRPVRAHVQLRAAEYVQQCRATTSGNVREQRATTASTGYFHGAEPTPTARHVW